MVGGWGIQSTKKKVYPLTYLVHEHILCKLRLSFSLMLCTLSAVHNTSLKEECKAGSS
jgi:hypothetical protein